MSVKTEIKDRKKLLRELLEDMIVHVNKAKGREDLLRYHFSDSHNTVGVKFDLNADKNEKIEQYYRNLWNKKYVGE